MSVSMKLPKQSKEGGDYPSPVLMPEKDRDAYPYGLCVRLEDDQIKKLKKFIGDVLPDAETTGELTVTFYVKRAESTDTASGGKRKCLELQITDIDNLTFGDEIEEKEKRQTDRVAKIVSPTRY